MHSGEGEEASDDNFRPLPIPREPQTSSASQPREGIVLPSKGGRWVPPSQRRQEEERWDQPAPVVQPAVGQPWGAPQPEQQQPPQAQPQPQPQPQHPQHPQQQSAEYGQPPAPGPQSGYPPPQHTDATQLLDPYTPAPPAADGGYGDQRYGGGYDQPYDAGQQMPAGDADRTQLMTPYGQQPPGGDGDRTQLLTPYDQPHSAELVPQPGDGRHPLPPEQQFNAPVPPLPQAPPVAPHEQYQQPQAGYQQQAPQPPQAQQPPMPGGAPYSIRPGAPGDQPPASYAQEPAPATQQLPRFEDNWQQQAPQAPGPQQTSQQPDDYDYLYRREDRPAAPQQPRQGAGPRQGYGFPQQQAQQPPRQDYGYNGQGGYDDPGGRGGHGGYDQPGRGQRKKPSTGVLVGAGVAVLALIGIGAGAILSGGGSGSQPSTGASSSPSGGTAGDADAVKAQATQLDQLLSTSNDSRTSVINAVASIKACKNLAISATHLRTAAGERDDLVTKLSQMKLDKLPNSAQLVSQLTAAWAASSSADNHYATWATQVAQPKGCHKNHAKTTPEVQRGNLSSGQATIAKQKAADLWNPIARQYGLTQRQFTQL